MGQSVRQQARQQALALQEEKRKERRERERRRSTLGVDVTVALQERDAAIERHDLAAGVALRRLTSEEGVSVADLAEWVPGLEPNEAKRLLKIAQASSDEAATPGDESE